MKRIKHNNLLPYFIMDERSLAKRKAYVRSCEKFFNELKLSSGEGGRVGPKVTSSQKIKVDKQKSNIYKYGKL